MFTYLCVVFQSSSILGQHADNQLITYCDCGITHDDLNYAQLNTSNHKLHCCIHLKPK